VDRPANSVRQSDPNVVYVESEGRVACLLPDDDESTGVRLLVANADFDSMMANGRQALDDLQRAADVVTDL